jgi:pyridinium-3,5-biscarboxylic acid mononucleotide sulfurtransferase
VHHEPTGSALDGSTPLSEGVAAKLVRLRAIVRGLDSALIAYSGGVDSTFVLRIAAEELGEHAVALTTTSAATPADEIAEAVAFAKEIRARHVVVPTDEVAISDYARNPINRCYFCKDNLYRICHEHLGDLDVAAIVDGVNVDDLRDHRPGLGAAAEQHVRHPLVEAGMTKAEVRAASRSLGLRTHDKPASPCLASRIPYGTEITHERLRQVEAAEAGMRALGFREFRVRFEGDTARLEVSLTEIDRCSDAAIRAAIVEAVRGAGFKRVVLDLQGFRSGSLNPPDLQAGGR